MLEVDFEILHPISKSKLFCKQNMEIVSKPVKSTFVSRPVGLNARVTQDSSSLTVPQLENTPTKNKVRHLYNIKIDQKIQLPLLKVMVQIIWKKPSNKEIFH